MGWILLLILVLLLVGSVPVWPHARPWGYYPAGGIVAALLIILLLVFLGVIPMNLPGRVNVDLPTITIDE